MFAITAASGQLGRLVVAGLLKAGVAPAEIVAVVRNPGRMADVARQGIEVRPGDYDRPESLAPAFAKADKVLFISGSEVGRRVPQHRNVVEAAVAAGVGSLAYTGLINTGTTTMDLAVEHRATEEAIIASGLPYTMLRNGWYIENYTAQIPQYLGQGAILGCAGSGRVSAATRAEFAAAAVAVLTTDGHENRIYELGGPSFTLRDLAGFITAAGRGVVTYRDLPADRFAAMLAGAGLPQAFATMIASVDVGIAAGALHTSSDDLERLIGRRPADPAEVVAEAVRKARR